MNEEVSKAIEPTDAELKVADLIETAVRMNYLNYRKFPFDVSEAIAKHTRYQDHDAVWWAAQAEKERVRAEQSERELSELRAQLTELKAKQTQMFDVAQDLILVLRANGTRTAAQAAMVAPHIERWNQTFVNRKVVENINCGAENKL